MIAAILVLHVFAISVCICSGFRLQRLRLAPTRISRVASRRVEEGKSIAQAHAVNVEERTRSCLDFHIIEDALQKHTRTVLGRSLVSASEVELPAVLRNYRMVDELAGHLSYLPFHSPLDMDRIMRMIDNNTALPDRQDLARFATDLDVLEGLAEYLHTNNDTLTLFRDIQCNLSLPQSITEVFRGSFDQDQRLSEDKYAPIRQLRQAITATQGSITATVQSLLQSPALKDKLASSECMEVDGRYCIALKNTHKRGVGIVHGSSNSGRTIYVEPSEVVELTNRLKDLRGQLAEEENRVYYAMCRAIHLHREVVQAAVRAAAELDVLTAKARLGLQLGGVIPEVGNEGVMRCQEAKHPVLLLRSSDAAGETQTAPSTALQRRLAEDVSRFNSRVSGRDGATSVMEEPARAVVGNALDLSEESPALVISGPNAGGKTIVLKTAGLFALMVQHSIPLPARRGARVDLFRHVLADIGDMQSVSGDISTFSGHLVVCKGILDMVTSDAKEAASVSGGHSLVLLDEVGTGTDPAQGSALAQAVLEELVSAGARVVTTTHYSRVKELAVADPRFRIAAMEYVDHRPTYELRVGSIGESFALEVAKRMKLPAAVLSRADALLGDESRRLLALQVRLQEETEKARRAQAEHREKLAELAGREQDIELSRQEAAGLIKGIRENKTAQYLQDLREKERQLEDIMVQARNLLAEHSAAHAEAVQSKKGSLRAQSEQAGVQETLQGLRETVKAEKQAAERSVIAATASTQLKATPLVPGQPVEAGTELMVLEPGNMLQGSKGVVTHRNKGRGRVVLRIAGVEIKMDRHLLGVPQPRWKLDTGQLTS